MIVSHVIVEEHMAWHTHNWNAIQTTNMLNDKQVISPICVTSERLQRGAPTPLQFDTMGLNLTHNLSKYRHVCEQNCIKY